PPAARPTGHSLHGPGQPVAGRSLRHLQQLLADPAAGKLIGTTPIAIATPPGPAHSDDFQLMAPLPLQAGLPCQHFDPVTHHRQEMILGKGIEGNPQAEAVGQGNPVLDGLAWVQLAVDHAAVQIVALLFRQQVTRSEEHTSELQSRENLVCRLLLEKKKLKPTKIYLM